MCPERSRNIRKMLWLSLALLWILGGCVKYAYQPVDIDIQEHIPLAMYQGMEELSPEQVHSYREVTTIVMKLPSSFDHTSWNLRLNQEIVELFWSQEDDYLVSSVTLALEKEYHLQLCSTNMNQPCSEEYQIVINQEIPQIKYKIDEKESMYLSNYGKGKFQILVEDEDFEPFASYLEIDDVIMKNAWTQKDKQWLYEVALDEGEHLLHVHAEDQKGNQNIKTKKIIIDTTAPLTSINYEDKEYHNKDVAISIEVEEDNFSDEQASVEVKRNDEAYPIDVLWLSKDDKKVADLSFEEEGKYELNLKIADKAGNPSHYQLQGGQVDVLEPIIIHIDKTAPLVKIERTPTQTFIKDDVDIFYQVFDEALSAYELYVYKDNRLLSSDIMDSNQPQTYHIPKNENGTYRMRWIASDKAGNQSIEERFFTIDTIAPDLDIRINNHTIPQDNMYTTNQDCLLTASWKDTNLASQEVKVLKNGIEITPIWNDQSILLSCLSEANKTIEYLIEVKIMDKAGNSKHQVFTLRQDTTAPTIELANDVFFGKARNITWTPQLTPGNEEYQVVDVVLYRDKQLVTTYNWGDEISEDGSYTLRARVRDQAMNESLALEEYNFTIDKTSPYIRLIDTDIHSEITELNIPYNHNVRLQIKDNFDEFVQITKLLWNEEDLSKDVKNHEVRLPMGQEGVYLLQIEAIDEAGNVLSKSITYQGVYMDVSSSNSLDIPLNTRLFMILLGCVCGCFLYKIINKKHAI